MAKWIFRRPRKSVFLREYQKEPCDMSGLSQLCVGLSQDDIENLSLFRMEANMLRAKNGQEAVEMDEALRYLKATGFNSSKANDVFKNYMKHRETYNLDSLKPYREPLSSEIGSKKLEIIGTQDSEGSPVVIFTGSRHDVKSSEHKSSMQLLFYTLDQLAESEEAVEKGVVFIMDMRDCSLSSFDVRYVNNFLSVLRDGYPLLIKRVYVVSAPLWMKGQVKVSKALKQDHHKIKFVAFSELSKYFSEDQLPLSLSGTFIPNTVQHQSRQPQERGPLGSPPLTQTPKQSQTHSQSTQSHSHSTQFHSHSTPPISDSSTPSSGVTNLVSKFGGGRSGLTSSQQHTTTSSPSNHQHLQPSSPHRAPLSHPHKKQHSADQTQQVKGHLKPTPPVKLSPAASPVMKIRPTPPPKAPNNTEQMTTTTTGVAASDAKASGAFKVPLMPPSGFKPAPPSKGPGHIGKVGGHKGGGMKATTPDKSPGALGVAARIKNFEHKKKSGAEHPPESSRPPLRKTSSEDWPLDGSKKTELSSSWAAGGESERKRADSAGNSPNLQTRGSPTRNRRARVPIKLRSPDVRDKWDHSSKEVVRQPMLPRSFQPPPSSKPGKVVTNQDYENLDSCASTSEDVYENVSVDTPPTTATTSSVPAPSLAPPPPPPPSHAANSSRGGGHAQNTTPDSKAYENVVLQTQQYHPPPTSKPPPQPSHSSAATTTKPLRDAYENVTVLEDDETLFGKEGPPGMQEVIYENFGTDDGYRAMSVYQLEEHIKSKGKKGLSAEYYRIRNEPLVGLYEACRLPYNTSKNRYKDVVCYDSTRVTLNRIPGLEGSDYIHANYVNGYKKHNSFILTQGPKDKTVADFWRMVWEKRITIIVMITKCVELGKRKCSQYWPEESDSPVCRGNVTVSVSETQNCKEGYDIRKINISCQGVERTVTHYHFLAWPDYGVPNSGSSVLSLLLSVRKARSKSSSSPVMVHCSAGVGRSGAFVALDNGIDELLDLKTVNLQAAVRKIREQRAYCIQTDEQYEFCYRTLLEYAKSVGK